MFETKISGGYYFVAALHLLKQTFLGIVVPVFLEIQSRACLTGLEGLVLHHKLAGQRNAAVKQVFIGTFCF